MAYVMENVTVLNPYTGSNEIAKCNCETITKFFTAYCKPGKRDFFYDLWVKEAPCVITPFVTEDVATCTTKLHEGWKEIEAFFDPIFLTMKGKFDWFIEDFIVGEDPNMIITKTTSDIDVMTSGVYGEKSIAYKGTYVQIWKFIDGRLKSFEEYYDTALLNSKYA